MIPQFTQSGLLPKGEWAATLTDVQTRYGINPSRKKLLRGMNKVVRVLAKAGCQRLWIDGSFITDKALPNDIDLLYDEAGLDWDLLAELEPVLLDLSHSRAAQKAKFGCEAFSASWIATIEGEPFLSFFQHDRFGNPKGIIRLEIGKGVAP